MHAHIERDNLTGSVKLWLFNESALGGETAFMFPMDRDEHGYQQWATKSVPANQHPGPDVFPVLEFSRPMWEAFIKAVREADTDLPANPVLAKALEREQARVDAMLGSLLKHLEAQNLPQYILSKGEAIHDLGL